MQRVLVLFAREPAREARSKGFTADRGAEIFAAFACGWFRVAKALGARVLLATPAEDLAGWKRRLPPGSDVGWLVQRGQTLGQRLEDAARRVSRLPGHAIFVGGDVAPDLTSARSAFEALERGLDAVISPSSDGGVSLVALAATDHDLLGRIGARRRDVFATLARALEARGRAVAVVGEGVEVDCRSDLRRLVRSRCLLVARGVARHALRRPVAISEYRSPVLPAPLGPPSGLRAPPAAA